MPSFSRQVMGPLRLSCPSPLVLCGSTYRDHVHAVSKGVPAREVMAELFGKSTGCCRGQGGSMHMFSKEWGLLGGFAFIGEGIPVACGAAFKAKYAKEVLHEENSDQVSGEPLLAGFTCVCNLVQEKKKLSEEENYCVIQSQAMQEWVSVARAMPVMEKASSWHLTWPQQGAACGVAGCIHSRACCLWPAAACDPLVQACAVA